ncbi:hypothetical protein BDZ91DRAFT_852753 [Kalaharituber pfeilii]|nr:hypothetical protein BDZ91DRAFT_852753 [Kalaharituber pfeilii]
MVSNTSTAQAYLNATMLTDSEVPRELPVPDIIPHHGFSRPEIPTSTSLSTNQLRSQNLFKIMIPGEPNTHNTATDQVPTTLDAATYTYHYIHKAILSTLSRELDSHVNNEMREGTESTMILRDVDRMTLDRFLEWAYTRLYTTPAQQYLPAVTSETSGERRDRFSDPGTDLPESVLHRIMLGEMIYQPVPWGIYSSSPREPGSYKGQCEIQIPDYDTTDAELMAHVKLYVFGDRFNIRELRDLALCLVAGILGKIGGSNNGFSDRAVTDFIQASAYALANLPLTTLQEPCSYEPWNEDLTPEEQPTKSSFSVRRPPVDPMEHLLAYLVRFTAWVWESFRQNEALMNFLLYDAPSEFRTEVFANLTPRPNTDINRYPL